MGKLGEYKRRKAFWIASAHERIDHEHDRVRDLKDHVFGLEAMCTDLKTLVDARFAHEAARIRALEDRERERDHGPLEWKDGAWVRPSPFKLGQRVRVLPGTSDEELTGKVGQVAEVESGQGTSGGEPWWILKIDLANENRRITVSSRYVEAIAKEVELEDELCEELGKFLGEVRESESALDVLRRVTAELRERRRTVINVFACRDCGCVRVAINERMIGMHGCKGRLVQVLTVKDGEEHTSVRGWWYPNVPAGGEMGFVAERRTPDLKPITMAMESLGQPFGTGPASTWSTEHMTPGERAGCRPSPDHSGHCDAHDSILPTDDPTGVCAAASSFKPFYSARRSGVWGCAECGAAVPIGVDTCGACKTPRAVAAARAEAKAADLAPPPPERCPRGVSLDRCPRCDGVPTACGKDDRKDSRYDGPDQNGYFATCRHCHVEWSTDAPTNSRIQACWQELRDAMPPRPSVATPPATPAPAPTPTAKRAPGTVTGPVRNLVRSKLVLARGAPMTVAALVRRTGLDASLVEGALEDLSAEIERQGTPPIYRLAPPAPATHWPDLTGKMQPVGPIAGSTGSGPSGAPDQTVEALIKDGTARAQRNMERTVAPVERGQTRANDAGEVVRVSSLEISDPPAYQLVPIVGLTPVPKVLPADEIATRWPIKLAGNLVSVDEMTPEDQQAQMRKRSRPSTAVAAKQCRANDNGDVIRVDAVAGIGAARGCELAGVVGKAPPSTWEVVAVEREWPIVLAEPVERVRPPRPDRLLNLGAPPPQESPSNGTGDEGAAKG